MTPEDERWLQEIEDGAQSGKPIPLDMVQTIHQLIAKIRELDQYLYGK